MTEDWTQDPSARVWIDHVLKEMVPPMKQSAFVMQLVPDDVGEVKFWVELGAAIMLEKPLIAIVLGDREIPPKLRQFADEVVHIPDGVSPDASVELREAIERIAGKDDSSR
jgi:hypothetical protein